MGTPENRIKKWVDDQMKHRLPGAWRYCPPGGRFGSNGQPDRLYFYRALFIAIECKAEGGVATELQKKRLQEISDNGGIVAIIEGKDSEEMERVFNEVANRLRELDLR